MEIDSKNFPKLQEHTLVDLLDLSEAGDVFEIWAPNLHRCEHAGALFVERFTARCAALEAWNRLDDLDYLKEKSSWAEVFTGKWCQAKGHEILIDRNLLRSVPTPR